MATLDAILDNIRAKQGYLDLVEVVDTYRTGSKLKSYEVYFGQPGSSTVKVEYVSIYINGSEARVVTPCFFCDTINSFRDSILPEINCLKTDADKVRVMFVDETERFALVEKVVYNSSDGTASTKLFKIYELPDKTIRVVES